MAMKPSATCGLMALILACCAACAVPVPPGYSSGRGVFTPVIGSGG